MIPRAARFAFHQIRNRTSERCRDSALTPCGRLRRGGAIRSTGLRYARSR